jgi:acetyl esterase
MPLDPQVRALLDEMPAGALDYDALPVEVIRAGFRGLALARGEAVHAVADRAIPGPDGDVAVRIYTPAEGGPLPALVFFHGGGFVTGDLDSHDALCRALANGAACVVVSVDYRLAPEHKFPAAPEDCFAGVRWVARHAAALGVDPGRLAVGGDSAGGNLAAVTALLCRERGGPALRHQLLLYPVIAPAFETASYRENASGYLLSRDAMRWFWRQYLHDAREGRDPRAAPVHAPSFAGVAPATVLTAEFDPLRDEGEAYARRLAEAGVPTRLSRYEGQIHGFLLWPDRIDRAREAIAEAAQALRLAFATGGP